MSNRGNSWGAFHAGDTLPDQTRRQAVRHAHDDVPALRCGQTCLTLCRGGSQPPVVSCGTHDQGAGVTAVPQNWNAPKFTPMFCCWAAGRSGWKDAAWGGSWTPVYTAPAAISAEPGSRRAMRDVGWLQAAWPRARAERRTRPADPGEIGTGEQRTKRNRERRSSYRSLLSPICLSRSATAAAALLLPQRYCCRSATAVLRSGLRPPFPAPAAAPRRAAGWPSRPRRPGAGQPGTPGFRAGRRAVCPLRPPEWRTQP